MLEKTWSLRARALAWWHRCRTDPEKRDFRRIGIISFGVVGLTVVLARLTQDTPAGVVIRALAITLFALAAIALLGVVILMGEEVVEEMDESDPLRARHGGAYGARVKRFFRGARQSGRTWIGSLPGNVAAWRHELTRESLAKLATASVEALSGVPPADAGPPPGAGRLARTTPASGPVHDPEPASEPARRRALTASELADRLMSTGRRRAASARSSRTARRTPRSAPRSNR